MIDPVELEQKAEDWLLGALQCIPVILTILLGLFLVAGLIGLVVGFGIRAAKWAMGG